MKSALRALRSTSAAAFALASLLLPTGAATLSGQVEILDQSGKRGDRSNVVLWLEGPGTNAPRKKGPAKGNVEMKSKEKKFQPGVLVVPVGSEVTFPNVDPIFHNVFSVSGDNRFDLGLYKSGASKSWRFEKPGLVRVFCNIHSGMIGFIHVLDTPFFAQTGPTGSFELRDVPPGSYTLKAWEERAGESSRSVTLSDSSPPLAIEIDARGFVPKPHLNKYGKPYPARTDDDERY
jgi:plastocyanin